MNTRFSIAIHILTFLQTQDGVLTSSDLLASSVGTNPVVIRRIMPLLAKAGLVQMQLGQGGGARLARAAEDISLLDVYRALDDEFGRFGIHEDPNPACLIGRRVKAALESEVAATERALVDRLSRRSIAELTADILAIP